MPCVTLITVREGIARLNVTAFSLLGKRGMFLLLLLRRCFCKVICTRVSILRSR